MNAELCPVAAGAPRPSCPFFDVLYLSQNSAIGGLDDLRGFQAQPVRNATTGLPERTPVSVYASRTCLDALETQFFYLFPKKETRRSVREGNVAGAGATPDGTKKVRRFVAKIDWRVVEPFRPFVAAGLKMTPLPMLHGADLICNGYAFSVNGRSGRNGGATNVVYVSIGIVSEIRSPFHLSEEPVLIRPQLSDISEMLPETEKYILEELPPTDILVLDALTLDRPSPVHFNLKQSLALVRRLKPKRTYLVGMGCDSFLPHDEMNKELEGLDVQIQFAHDGLLLEAE